MRKNLFFDYRNKNFASISKMTPLLDRISDQIFFFKKHDSLQ